MNWDRLAHEIAQQRNEIIRAFIAKYGCGPQDVVMKQNYYGASWIEMRDWKDKWMANRPPEDRRIW